MDEKALERHLCATVKHLGGLALKWLNPWFTGVPDRIVILPWRRIYFVELKSPGGRVSPRQKVVFEWLAKLGWPVTVIFNREQLFEFYELIEREDNRAA